LLLSVPAQGQEEAPKPIAIDNPEPRIKAVPILTGYAAYFTQVTGGEFANNPSFIPVLLLPIGDKWLVEAKGTYSDSYAKGDEGYYEGSSAYGVAYAQVDYIANRYVTLTGGRFITPFGIYGERLFPNWIRALQTTPLNYSLASGSSLGGMLRGGLPAGTDKINFDYAVYFSSANTNHVLATDRSTGGRISLFLPGPRLEIGASFQQELQLDRAHSAGVHFEWQPNRLPLTLRSEYVRQSGTKGSGYWIEAVYRLSQIPPLRRLELAGRGQQFYADSKLTPVAAANLGALGLNTNHGDFGLNYYLRSDLRASVSYGRQFVAGKDANLWVMGMTYRFLAPLGPTGGIR
jgi:hypothetical protein